MFLHGKLADFIVDLFAAQISRDAQARGLHLLGNALGVVNLIVRNGSHSHLEGAQPHRHRARVVFDEHTDPALQRPENGAVQHHGHLAAVVFGDVFGTEAAGHLEVNLHRTALPGAAEAVL